MSNLIVVGFKNHKYKAAVALNKLRQMDEWKDQLDDAVAVYRGYDGELRIDQSYKLTTDEGAAWGTFWGSLIGLVLAIPLTGGATAPAAAMVAAGGALTGAAVGASTGIIGADWWKEEYGIPEGFVSEAGSMIQPGDSAIFALVERVFDGAVKEFEGFGGKVLLTTLTPEQDAKIQKVLNQRR
jgi:uncharacterized membrane protein